MHAYSKNSIIFREGSEFTMGNLHELITIDFVYI